MSQDSGEESNEDIGLPPTCCTNTCAHGHRLHAPPFSTDAGKVPALAKYYAAYGKYMWMCRMVKWVEQLGEARDEKLKEVMDLLEQGVIVPFSGKFRFNANINGMHRRFGN